MRHYLHFCTSTASKDWMRMLRLVCVCEFVCVWCVFILAFRAYHVRKLHLNTTSGFRNTTSGFLRVSMRNVAVD